MAVEDKKTFSLTVKQWEDLWREAPVAEENFFVWFNVTGFSMLPFVRPYLDKVMIKPARKNDLKRGDVVLFPGKFKGGDYCLHRIYKMENGSVQTFGDGNLAPDKWIPVESILGKAVAIKRGYLTINCESKVFMLSSKLWSFLLPVRSYLLLPFRAGLKIRRLFSS